MYKQQNQYLLDDSCLDLFYEQLFILTINPEIRYEVEKDLSASSKKLLRQLIGEMNNDR